jgi:hypothetical protein
MRGRCAGQHRGPHPLSNQLALSLVEAWTPPTESDRGRPPRKVTALGLISFSSCIQSEISQMLYYENNLGVGFSESVHRAL